MVRIAGLVTAVRRTMTKAQSQMLIAAVEDTTGTVECIVFPKQYAELQMRFIEDAIIVVSGRLRRRERRGAPVGDEAPLELSVSVSDVQTFDRAAVRSAAVPAGWHVTVTSRDQIDDAGDHRVGERLAAIVGASNVAEGSP